MGLTQELGQGQQRNVSLPRTWIETQAAGLALRLVREADDEALFPLFADWDVIRWLSSPPWPYTRKDMQSFVRAQAATDSEDAEMRFAITLEQAPIGIIGVRMQPASHLQRGDGPNIGYWLGRRYWGHGYMTAALRGVVDHVFCMQPHDAIYCGAFVGNCASLRVQEKVGFVRDGETMLYSRPRGGEFPHINPLLTRAKLVSH
jgi:RimJ/RimL family protein N-acetyltransferase